MFPLIWLHLFQYHLLNAPSYFYQCPLLLLLYAGVHMCVSLFLGWILYHFGICQYVSIPICWYLKHKHCFSKLYWYVSPLHSFVNSRLRLSSSINEPHGFLFGVILHLNTNLRRISIFTILSILIHEVVWLLIYFDIL